MKNNKGKNNRMSNYDTIVIDELIKDSGIDLDKYKTAQSKAKKRKSVIDSITKLLDSWKKKGHITSYKINKGGSGKRKDSIHSITITV